MSSELLPVANSSELRFTDEPRVMAAKRGVGTFLLFDLESAKAPKRKRPENTVWVYLCDWVIRRGTKVVCDSDFESPQEVDEVLNRMLGESLTALRLTDDATSATLHFSGTWEVELQEATDIYEPGSDMVRVFADQKLAVAVRYPGGLMVAPSVETVSMADMMRSMRGTPVSKKPMKGARRVLGLGRRRRPRGLKRA